MVNLWFIGTNCLKSYVIVLSSIIVVFFSFAPGYIANYGSHIIRLFLV